MARGAAPAAPAGASCDAAFVPSRALSLLSSLSCSSTAALIATSLSVASLMAALSVSLGTGSVLPQALILS